MSRICLEKDLLKLIRGYYVIDLRPYKIELRRKDKVLDVIYRVLVRIDKKYAVRYFNRIYILYIDDNKAIYIDADKPYFRYVYHRQLRLFDGPNG